MLLQPGSWMVRAVERQCLVRDANEVLELANAALPTSTARGPLRCECDDPACAAEITPTHAAYEEVRSSGSLFLVATHHENPENACVVREADGYAVIDVVVGDARHAVRVENQRHAWTERRLAPRDSGWEEGAS